MPEERTETAGFCTVKLAPYGYTKLSDLYEENDVLFECIATGIR